MTEAQQKEILARITIDEWLDKLNERKSKNNERRNSKCKSQ